MATYSEILSISQNPAILNLVEVAVCVTANTIMLEPTGTTNHAARLLWAKATLADPLASARGLIWSVLVQNKALTAAQILAASDAAVQTAVDAAVLALVY